MKQYESWIVKAESDLKSAKKLLSGSDPILDTATYHTQQCAEKALKAYLAFKQQSINKTHDVELLVELCATIDKEFELLIEDAEELNPYSTAFRYPDIVLEPEQDEVEKAIQRAEKILSFVKNKTV